MAKFIAQEALNNAVLFKLFELAQSGNGGASADNLSKTFDIPIGSRRVTLAFDFLAEKEWAVRSPNGWFSISSRGYSHVEKSILEETSPISFYAMDGDIWLSDRTLSNAVIPASDRVVSRKDNQAGIEAISTAMDEIVEALDRDNQIGAELGDDRQLLLHELAASKELIGGDRFYLRRLFNLISPALKFLSEKFSGAAIGEAAKHLFNLILALF